MYEGQSAKDARYAPAHSLDQPRSGTPIRDALMRLEELVQQAQGGAAAIGERLDVVLRPIATEPATTNDKRLIGRAGASHLEDRILTLVAAVVDLNGRMQDIHGRIEI